MSAWVQLGEDTLLNLDKVWHVSITAGARKEWEYEICFLVEMNFPDPNDPTKDQELWHEVRENFQTKEELMIAVHLVSDHLKALHVDHAVKDYKRQFGIGKEETGKDPIRPDKTRNAPLGE